MPTSQSRGCHEAIFTPDLGGIGNLLVVVHWLGFRTGCEGSSRGAGGTHVAGITLWEPLFSPKYALYERVALVVNVVVALAGLAYALMLVSR